MQELETGHLGSFSVRPAGTVLRATADYPIVMCRRPRRRSELDSAYPGLVCLTVNVFRQASGKMGPAATYGRAVVGLLLLQIQACVITGDVHLAGKF